MALIGWGLMFIVLAVQLVFTMVFLLPLPAPLFFLRKMMVNAVLKVKHVLLLVALFSAMLAYQSYIGFSHHDHRIGKDDKLDMVLLQQNRSLRNQRNFYLSIMCLTMSLVLLRVAAILKSNLELYERVKEVKKITGTTTTTSNSSTSNTKKEISTTLSATKNIDRPVSLEAKKAQ